MDKNDELIKIIANMTEEERQALMQSLSNPQDTAPPTKKQKFRRKKNKQVDTTSTPQSKKIRRITKEGTKKEGRVQATIKKFDIGPRPNKFEQSPVFNAEKHLIDSDKSNWQHIQPTPRERQITIYEVECSKCGRVCEARENEIFFSGPDEYSYYCARCGGRS